ncbi:MAG: hypothetical protein GWP91_18245 [Rhodobacterales bacterium]|nr:hypothetical protein [Rhodobacterales bacterium]
MLKSTPWISVITLALLMGCGSNEANSNVGNAAATPGDAPSVEIEGQIVVEVGQGGVTAEEYLAQAMRSPSASSGDMSEAERKEILNSLVTEEALWQEAVSKGLYRDPKVRKIMVNLLLREEIYSNVKASDFAPDELRAYYDTHIDEFVVPEKLQVKRIFLKTGPELDTAAATKMASELRAQLVAQPDRFKELASLHSDGPYKRRGGDLGYLSREGKPGIEPDVIGKAFELDVGEISQPFEAAGGINIVAVASRRDRQERTFEQMKGSVLRKLKNERYKELTDGYISGVKDRYPITVDQEAIDGLDLTKAREGRAATDGASPVSAPPDLRGHALENRPPRPTVELNIPGGE